MAEHWAASGSSGHSELAGSLVTVAIAALGGPVSAAGAALAEVIKGAQARYKKEAPTRDLHRHVTAAVAEWAKGERLAPEAVRLGLGLATDTVAHLGLDYEAIAHLNFEPEAVVARVLQEARDRDRYWGTEDHYGVAERAIAETYHVLIQQIQVNERILLSAIQALRGSIDHYAAQVEVLGRSGDAQLRDLTSALIAGATVADVMVYLQARIEDWDVSIWHPGQQRASALERRVQVRSTDQRPPAGDSTLTAEDALTGQQMLVVLGGPGSGKSWLARRYAREAARVALRRLEDGAGLDEVELPLLTTWDQWTKTGGDPRESLVAASFASGLGHRDPDADGTVIRLQRTLLQASRRVLLIVDSLDEAADRVGQAARLHELTSLLGWRVVITSRPAAWEATFRGDTNGVARPRVVELRTLVYPDDVEAFIQAWFATDPVRGEAMIRQIRARDKLAEMAVIPLILTFYCLLTEPPADANQPLPASSQDLYRRLIRRLLIGQWTANPPGPDTAPDWDECEELLRTWAGRVVQEWTTLTGLGDWGENFLQPTKPKGDAARAIDHVAPKVAVDGEGRITRRFVHRTILEHCVAEHIAALSPDDAIGTVLPHLWFDPDWQVTAPAAIAAHNRRQQGALFQRFLERACHPATDSARRVASRECDRLLLAIAEESEPGDWALEHQEVFDECRARNAIDNPAAVVRTAHWTRSNQRARAAVLAALSRVDAWDIGGLVTALFALISTDAERAEARTGVLAALPALTQGRSAGWWRRYRPWSPPMPSGPRPAPPR